MTKESNTDTPSIAINGVSHPILCGICRAPISFRGEHDGERSEAGCSFCGNFAETQQVAKIAVEYAKNEGQLILNRMARDTARKSKIMTFSGDTEHKQTYAFVVDLDF